MKSTTVSTLAAAIAALALAGCEGAPAGGDAAAPTEAMPAMPQSAPSRAEHMAEGTLNSIDRAAGTVNISHEPVASAGWPAMTMSFKLKDRSATESLALGRRIEFRFTIENGMAATVTAITAK